MRVKICLKRISTATEGYHITRRGYDLQHLTGILGNKRCDRWRQSMVTKQLVEGELRQIVLLVVDVL